jgi:hypothetical protein
MGKKPTKPVNIPKRRIAHSVPPRAPQSSAKTGPKRSGSTWPYVLLMMCGWAVIFAGLCFSYFLSGPARYAQSDDQRPIAGHHHPG